MLFVDCGFLPVSGPRLRRLIVSFRAAYVRRHRRVFSAGVNRALAIETFFFQLTVSFLLGAGGMSCQHVQFFLLTCLNQVSDHRRLTGTYVRGLYVCVCTCVVCVREKCLGWHYVFSKIDGIDVKLMFLTNCFVIANSFKGNNRI